MYQLKNTNGETVQKSMGEICVDSQRQNPSHMDNGTHFKNRWVDEVLTKNFVIQVWSITCARHTNGMAEWQSGELDWVVKNASNAEDVPC